MDIVHLPIAAVLRAIEDEGEAGGEIPSRTRFVASTDAPDRYDDVVDQGNWQLASFLANPVIPWGHDYERPPVGKAVEVSVTEGKLVIVVEWDMESAVGREVARQYAKGFLNAGSVGFRPGRAVRRNQLPKEDPRFKDGGFGMVFYDNELLEFSAVVIPANGQALAQREVEELVARGLGVGALAMDDGARRALEARELGEALRPVLRTMVEEAIADAAPRLRALVGEIADDLVTETLARGLEAQADAEEAGLWDAIAAVADEGESDDDGLAWLTGSGSGEA